MSSRSLSRPLLACLTGIVLLTAHAVARADASEALRQFVQTVQSARSGFTQTVSSPDGAKKKTSSGTFEFQRPNRFRFDYSKPYEQQVVADGVKVWMYDLDLNQVTVRPYDQALGQTPAALLTGGQLDRDFTLRNEADEGGLQWVLATPRGKEGSIRQLRIGFRGRELAAFEMTDAFGQRSRLEFTRLETQAAIPAARFKFVAPAGADVLNQ
ncbi:outer membrane lipoprotein carrier protein [Sphaerotilus hippei]|uniref:Outer-membrane lipoprotein carrier protein n=1 Tax=Sphaerotilus hippei TaxID=744406 RepID=A0A318H3R3_9BURK|nr:outer membrane lipoprotein chaperone LolA [Sphaerotilus hippei]PXW96536.1 outer membrane lipoprotein carrier protein [Sphaerotilus hippei]